MAPLLILGFLEFVRGALVFSILPLYGQYHAGYSLATVGLAISLHYLIENAFRIPMGWLIDRFGGKSFLAAGVMLSVVGILLIYLHWSTGFFILGALIFGLGMSPIWPAVITGVAANMHIQQIGEALSKVYMAWIVGAGAGPVVVNFVIGQSFGLAFLINFVVLAITLVFTLGVKIPHRVIPKEPMVLAEFWQELNRLKLLYPGMFVQTLSIGLLMPVVTIYAHRVFGLRPDQFNYLLIGAGMFTVLLLVPAGKIADQMGVKKPLSGGFLVAALCLILLPLQRQLVWALVIGAVLGMAYSFILPAWNGLLARAIAPEKRGTIWAVFMTIEGMGTGVGAFIGGKVWDTFGPQAPFFISAFVVATMAIFYTFGNVEKLIHESATVR